IVDDYALITASINPLAPLIEFIALGREIGLHLIVAHRVAGASRAMFDGVVQRVRDAGSAGLILSGDPHEGALIGGHRAIERPPGPGLLVRRRHEPAVVQIAMLDGVDQTNDPTSMPWPPRRAERKPKTNSTDNTTDVASTMSAESALISGDTPNLS